MEVPEHGVTSALSDRYRVDREIGSGGWAVVYLAHDLKIGRQVAIKALRRELATDIGTQRFEREIEVAARLHHPHLLEVLDSGIADGVPYYVMPYLDGDSLRDRLRREGPLPLREAMRIAREVAEALAYAHAQGVIHRDIKPANIMLEAGHAVVTDFGIAALTQAVGVETLTDTGEVPGTPQYMSPEQLDGESRVDGRSDVYSLGCVLYEMLAGDPPITGSKAHVVIARKLMGEIPRLRVARPSVPEVLERAVEKALARVPGDRFQNASDLADALASIRGEVPTPEERLVGRRRSLAERVAIGAAAVLAGLAATAVIGFLTTAAFDTKLQVPEAFRPTRTDNLVIGGRALLPVFVFGLVGIGLFLVGRQFARTVTATVTRVPVLSRPTRLLHERVATRMAGWITAARPSTLADLFFLTLIAISVFLVVRFDDVFSVLWSTDVRMLGCEHKPLHRAFLLSFVALIGGFGGAWFRVFPWIERRTLVRARIALARWGSLLWLLALTVLLTLPWRILNHESERLRVDGRPAYLLEEAETALLVYLPDRGLAEAHLDDARVERLGVRGSMFEGTAAFESGVPGCGSITMPSERSAP